MRHMYSHPGEYRKLFLVNYLCIGFVPGGSPTVNVLILQTSCVGQKANQPSCPKVLWWGCKRSSWTQKQKRFVAPAQHEDALAQTSFAQMQVTLETLIPRPKGPFALTQDKFRSILLICPLFQSIGFATLVAFETFLRLLASSGQAGWERRLWALL